MLWFVLGFILLVIALLVALFARPTTSGDLAAARFVKVATTGLGLLLVGLSLFTVVGTRNEGVVTQFGAPTGRTIGNGLAVKLPWQAVSDVDRSVQTRKYVGGDHCIGVRITDGSTACVSVVLRYRIAKGAADTVFVDYRPNDTYDSIIENISDTLVRTQLTDALGQVFGDYNPLLVPGAVAASDDNTTADPKSVEVQTYAAEVRKRLVEALADQGPDGKPEVDVLSLNTTYIRLSDSTQKRLNQLQAEVANTRIAKQRQATATANAQANRNLASSLAQNPNVLVAQCFDTLQARTDAGLSIPAGFSCWPGGSGATPVVPVR